MNDPALTGPRAPRRESSVHCFSDCPAQDSGDATDCTCAERDLELYEAECDRRLDAWRNGD